MRPTKRTLNVKRTPQQERELETFPNAGPYPNITGMKKHYWGKDALCIKCGPYVYHVDAETYRKFGGDA